MDLQGKKILMPVADGTHELELYVPYYRLLEEGAEVVMAGPDSSDYTGKNGFIIRNVISINGLDPTHFDGVVIPGGYGPDKIRTDKRFSDFVKVTATAGKLVAAICHAGWILAEAGIINGIRLTSVPNIRTDLENAGAEWIDREVVVDGNIITSRIPVDLPHFCREIVKFLKSV